MTVQVFNSALECGVRCVFILVAAHPRVLDLQRVVDFDYLSIHSADVGGEASLHAPLPLRSAELLIRRALIQRGLLLMISRGLVKQRCSTDGIFYEADESAASFTDSLSAPYALALRGRTEWVVRTFGETTDDDLRRLMKSFFNNWTSEFQPSETPAAQEPR